MCKKKTIIHSLRGRLLEKRQILTWGQSSATLAMKELSRPFAFERDTLVKRTLSLWVSAFKLHHVQCAIFIFFEARVAPSPNNGSWFDAVADQEKKQKPGKHVRSEYKH